MTISDGLEVKVTHYGEEAFIDKMIKDSPF